MSLKKIFEQRGCAGRTDEQDMDYHQLVVHCALEDETQYSLWLAVAADHKDPKLLTPTGQQFSKTSKLISCVYRS